MSIRQKRPAVSLPLSSMVYVSPTKPTCGRLRSSAWRTARYRLGSSSGMEVAGGVSERFLIVFLLARKMRDELPPALFAIRSGVSLATTGPGHAVGLGTGFDVRGDCKRL